MDNLREMNEKIYDKFTSFNNSDLACPNLVSSQSFNENICKHPIMYVGQETNGWVNYSNDNATLDDIEKRYDEFLMNYGTSKSTFWRFLKNCIKEDYENFYKSVVWCNTLIFGKRYDKGAPKLNDEMINLSLEYLLFLYEYFEPSAVINVSGNCNPYYNITKTFLDKVGSNIKDYPTSDQYLITDNDKNIMWTYHPLKLSYMKKFDDASELIYKNIKK